VANGLQHEGYTIAGTVQRSVERSDRCACDMIVRDLSTDRDVQISEDRGPDARGCRLDPRVLEALVGSTVSALDSGVDAVIINKFGKQEAQGAGFRGVIGQAVLRSTPVLIGVNVTYLDSWRAFAGGLADELKPDRKIILDWMARRLGPNAIGHAERTERHALRRTF
jgi:nucleoside-triphosphatase THEP1